MIIRCFSPHSSGKGYGAYSRQTAVGWRYMDKFVQLPFVIPPIDAERFA